MAAHSTTLSIMIQAVETAGRRLARDFGELEHLQISSRPPEDFVAKANWTTEDILKNHLEKSRPKYGFISEQSGTTEGKDSSNSWVVSPINGKTNFMHGLPFFSISIALQRDSRAFAGVIFNPVTNQMWLAEKGQGAWMLNRRLRVSRRKKLSETVNYTEMPKINQQNREDTLKRATILARVSKQTCNFSSPALALAYLSSGQFDSVFLENFQPWDIAAGTIIAQESGGFIRDFDGTQAMLTKGEVIATNGAIDKELRDILEKFSLQLPHYE